MKYLIILAIIISVPVLQTSAYAENPREAVTIHTARTIPISNPTTGEPELYLSGSVVNGTAQGTYSGVQAFSRASGALQGIVSADHTGERRWGRG